MPGVNFDYIDTTFLGFVGQEGMELGKAPTVQAALGIMLLARADLTALSDVLEVLNDNGAARGSMLNNALRKHVVMVSTLPQQLTRKLFQVPFSRRRAMFLKLTTETEDTAFLFFPAPLSQEVTGGGDGWPIQPQVYPDHFLRVSRSRFRDGNHHVQSPDALTVAEISTADFPPNVALCIRGNTQGKFNPSCYHSKATGQTLPLEPGGTRIVTDRTVLDVRARDRLEDGRRFALLESFGYSFRIVCCILLLPGKRTLHRLSGFDTSGTHQLSREIRICSTKRVVGLLMQCYSIPRLVREALMYHSIEAGRMLNKRTFQDACLFRRRMYVQNNCSIHAENISYMLSFVKYSRLWAAFFPPLDKSARVPERGRYEIYCS